MTGWQKGVADPPRSTIGLRIYLTVFSVLFGLAGLFSILPALLSVMMFDAPGATFQPGTIVLAVCVGTFPFVCFSGITAAWQAYWHENAHLARMVILLPCINLLVGWLAYLYVEMVQGGKFS